MRLLSVLPVRRRDRRPFLAAAQLAVAATALLLAALPAAAGAVASSVSGTVVDDLGAPVAGAAVSARLASDPAVPVGAPEVAGADGSYTIGGLADGEYVLYAEHAATDRTGHLPRYAPAAAAAAGAQVVTMPATLSGLQITLPRAASVGGRVLDLAGLPFAGASVSVSGSGELSQATVTFTGGQYLVTGLPAGQVTLTLAPPAEGGTGQSRTLTLATGERVSGFDLRNQRAASAPPSTTPPSGNPPLQRLPDDIGGGLYVAQPPAFGEVKSTLKVSGKGWLSIPVACASKSCAGSLVVERSRGKKSARRLGKAAVRMLDTPKAEIRVRLSKSARRSIKRAGRKGMKVRLRLVDLESSAVTRSVRVKAR